MKKIMGLFVAVLLSVTVLVNTASANEGGNEKCVLSENGAEDECEIWWLYNAKEHWRACVEHRDARGNDTIVSGAEPHEFEDGICAVCEAKETKGIGTYSYLFVFIVVLGIGFLIPFKMNRGFKKNKFDEHPFGLDKFKKFP